MTNEKENIESFEFWVPIEKGGVKEVNGERIIYGIASSEDIDMDNEIVSAGAIRKSLDYFLKHGRLDYDHKSKDDPKYIVGEPLAGRFDDKNNFHLKGKLYKGLEVADSVWQQLKAGNTRMGYSIGGRVLQKAVQFDRLTNKRTPKVTNALINHIAITPHPKNLSTWATVKPYGEWLKSLGSPKNNCCGMCEITGKSCDEMHKAVTAAGNTAVGTNPVMPQDLESDLKVFKKYLTSDIFSFDPDAHKKYFLTKGVKDETAKALSRYITKNKTRISKITTRRK